MGSDEQGGRRRKRSREQTRDRMLEAAVELLRREGLPALTTVRITREAGIVQSGFYAHFKSPEHLQKELAERTGRDLRESIATWMAALRAGGDDLASLSHCYAEVLGLFREQAALVDLFLRYRRSTSPLGMVLGHLHTQLRADFFQYLRERAGPPEATRAHLGTIGMHADVLVAALLGVAEGIVDGRVVDLPTAATELAALTLEPLRRLIGA
ncbi:MAG TPA: TetR/AcrR family transcriptional regulator [Sandaracinaceae bacterium]